jgi:peptidoglycan/LPS O-acetylase OafA/YrhL
MRKENHMKRSILGFLAGLAVWTLVATLLNFGLRAGIPGYTAAEPSMTFTLGMKIARLILGALASLAAGAATGLIAPSKRAVPWVLGGIILALFIPEHVQIWPKFPVWYHLTFLVSIVPLVAAGAGLIPKRSNPADSEGKISAKIDRARIA